MRLTQISTTISTRETYAMNSAQNLRRRNMATMPFTTRIAATLFLLLAAIGVCAAQHHVYQVTNNDHEYLQHYTVLAAFDSTVVSYVFGEGHVGSALLWDYKRIYQRKAVYGRIRV